MSIEKYMGMNNKPLVVLITVRYNVVNESGKAIMVIKR